MKGQTVVLSSCVDKAMREVLIPISKDMECLLFGDAEIENRIRNKEVLWTMHVIVNASFHCTVID